MMYKAVKQFALSLKGKLNIAIGLSGGPDSIALAHLLVRLRNDGIINSLTAIHFNHNLRGIESDNDENFAKIFCDKFDIEFISISLDVVSYCEEKSIGTEEAARFLRYSEFLRLKKKFHFDYIALGHNKNDKAETLLFNIFRGSGLKGIVSIENKRDFYIRPILTFSRVEILNYLKTNKLKYRIDSSNNEVVYSRNKIRNIIIPQVEELLERKIINNLVKLSDISAEILDFTLDYIKTSVTDLTFCKVFIENGIIYLNKAKFFKNKIYIQREILNFLLKKLGFGYNIDYKKSDILLSYLKDDSNKLLELLGFSFSIYKNTIIIASSQIFLKNCEICGKVELEKRYSIGMADIEFSTQNKTNTKLCISKELFLKGLSSKFTNKNISFLPFGKKNEIKLSKIISDKKVPIFFRDKLLEFGIDERSIFIYPIGTDKRTAVKTNEDKIFINIYNDLLDEIYL